MKEKNRWIIGSFSLIIIIGLIAGCLGDEEGDKDLLFSAKINCDSDVVTITVSNGSINWTGKELRVGNYKLITSIVSSEEGDEVDFVDTTGSFNTEEDIEYTVKIVYVVSGNAPWEAKITADNEDTGNEVETINIKASIDPTGDEVSFEIIQGDIDWSDFKIIVDGSNRLQTTSGNTTDGDIIIFTDPDGTWDAINGESYNVKIIHISESKVVYEVDVIAE